MGTSFYSGKSPYCFHLSYYNVADHSIYVSNPGGFALDKLSLSSECTRPTEYFNDRPSPEPNELKAL